jgi:hypothetical protein
MNDVLKLARLHSQDPTSYIRRAVDMLDDHCNMHESSQRQSLQTIITFIDDERQWMTHFLEEESLLDNDDVSDMNNARMSLTLLSNAEDRSSMINETTASATYVTNEIDSIRVLQSHEQHSTTSTLDIGLTIGQLIVLLIGHEHSQTSSLKLTYRQMEQYVHNNNMSHSLIIVVLSNRILRHHDLTYEQLQSLAEHDTSSTLIVNNLSLTDEQLVQIAIENHIGIEQSRV